MTGNIPFPLMTYGVIPTLPVVGQIPIGPARCFGVIGMPGVFGSIPTIPGIGQIPIGPVRCYGVIYTPGALGGMETPPHA